MKKWGRGTIVVILLMVLMLSSTGMAHAWWGYGVSYREASVGPVRIGVVTLPALSTRLAVSFGKLIY